MAIIKKNSVNTNEPLMLSNLDKVYWPVEGYTKGDLIHYYEQVAPLILPYLKDRPLTMRRYPNGITGESFYQKNTDHLPSWVHVEKVHHEHREVDYILVNNKETLLYVANLGCIDLHPFHSKIQALHHPTYAVMDLDPEDIPFEQVIEVAQAIHALLEEWKVPCLCKTSGSRGLHIYVPLEPHYDDDVVSQFIELIAQMIHRQLPTITSLEKHPKDRQHKVFLDYLRNHFGQTVVAPYTVRPRPGAFVSTPLDWKEVKKGLDFTQFNIKTVLKRFKKTGDLFAPLLKKGISLEKVLKKHFK